MSCAVYGCDWLQFLSCHRASSIQVTIDKATTGAVLKSFLNFLCTGKYSRKSVTDEDFPQLLQLAEHHRLTR